MSDLNKLITLLSDATPQSGESIGKKLGVSRAAVWKQIKQIEEMGLTVISKTGQGYQLSEAIELLDASAIASNAQGNLSTQQICILGSTISTNDYCQKQANHGEWVFAEHQTGGRGRRGKAWHSPYGSNLYMSLKWHFDTAQASLEGLSLVIGLAIARSFQSLNLSNIGLKWPNDVYIDNEKVSGILIDIQGDLAGLCELTIGIGVNIHMQKDQGTTIDQPWTSLIQSHSVPISRNQVAGLICANVQELLHKFTADGLPAFQDEWQTYDYLAGQSVTLNLGARQISGTAVGIDDGGALVIETKEGRQTYAGGEVSVKKQ